MSYFVWKNPREGFKFKNKAQGGFCQGKGFSNYYTSTSLCAVQADHNKPGSVYGSAKKVSSGQ